MSILHDRDNVISDPIEIEEHVVSYFQSIFSVDNDCGANNMVEQLVPRLVTEAETDLLCRLPMMSEIKSAVFDLNGDSAPGPDGFGGHFY